MADALSYAVKHYKPDAIIDFATLTGACAYALGPFFTGMMSQHDDLVERVQAGSKFQAIVYGVYRLIMIIKRLLNQKLRIFVILEMKL